MKIYVFRGTRLPYARPFWNSNNQEVEDTKLLYGSTVWVFKDTMAMYELVNENGRALLRGIPLNIVRHADLVVVVDRTAGTQEVIKNRTGMESVIKVSRLTVRLQELWCKMRAIEIKPAHYNPSHVIACVEMDNTIKKLEEHAS